MQKINSMSEILGLSCISMANKDTNPISMTFSTLLCTMIDIFVATLQDLCSCFCFILQSLSYFFTSNTWVKRWSNAAATGGAITVAASKPCVHEDHVKTSTTTLIKGDIEVVMESLGISWEKRRDGVDEEGILGSSATDISNLFDEMEPSLEEVKEAFDLFDSNKDGYIDAKDLNKILGALGFVDFSELDCQNMIMAFNTKSSIGNSGIDFGNFVKIIEGSIS